MLSNSQIDVLRAVVLEEPTLETARINGDDYAISDWCNAVASPAYKVWNTTTPTATIGDAITWGSLTPVDTPDGTATFTNRALAAQAKQLNLQILIQGRETLSTGRSNIRSGLQDALTDLPTGTSGALRNGGWQAVKLIIQRNATNAEKILTSGAGTATTPSDLVFEGQVTPTEASLLR